MKRTRKALWCGLAVILLAAGLVLANRKWISQAFTAWRQRRQEAFLNQRVQGYLTDQWRRDAFLVVRDLDYYGGHVNEFRWSNDGSRYRQHFAHGSQQPPPWSPPMQVNPQAAAALEDAINIILRDKLWLQKDLDEAKQMAEAGHWVGSPDGGERTFEFSVGPHRGRFRLINYPDAPHLRLFLHKVRLWRDGIWQQVALQKQQ